MQAKMKIKKDDEVIVLAGKDKGKTGKVIKAMPAESRVVVQGLNLVKRHERASQKNPQGGIISKEASLHVSNVALVDPKDGKAARVKFKDVDGKKVRVSTRTDEQFSA